MSKAHQGRFKPKNPGKYHGNWREIYYRSSWERTFMNWCDLREDVKSWSSEELAIQYYDPIAKKKRRYFPDFIMKVRESDGLFRIVMVEIKPHAQVVGPDRNPKRKTKAWVNAVQTYVTNQAKWEAAKAFCAKKGWKFQTVTEYDLGLKKRK